jgi:catechol 2,3-dioxygenase-like lactoylglutathione lyase family enzyme
MQFRFDHIHLRSPDPETTAEFYRSTFGAEITRSHYPSTSQYASSPKLSMLLGGQRILFAPAHPSKPNGAPPQAPYFGVEHIGLNVDDIDAVAKELDAKGVTFVQRPAATATGNRNAFVRGPEGVLIEIVQRGAGEREPAS